MTITESAPAKINLALHIRRKRPDGYHDLETLFAFARDGDVVTVSDAAQDSFTITGPFASLLDATSDQSPSPAEAGAQARPARPHPSASGNGTNLVIRAADAFRSAFGNAQPLAITLEKNLPVASGIGGGSADAAATLRAIARWHGIDPADPRLLAIARELGADVPACLLGRTAFAIGRGDDLRPLPPLGDLPLLLVNPGVPLSTAAMFTAWDGSDAGPLAREGDPLAIARRAGNSFTAPAVAAAPVIGEVLDLLATAPGATFSRLSGSGATCFALFADTAARDAAAVHARGRGWWTLATTAI